MNNCLEIPVDAIVSKYNININNVIEMMVSIYKKNYEEGCVDKDEFSSSLSSL